MTFPQRVMRKLGSNVKLAVAALSHPSIPNS